MSDDIKIKTASGETLVFERKKLKDFDGDHRALMKYYGKIGGLIKHKNRRDLLLEPQYKKIINLYLNGDATQAQIAKITGISQGYISNFIKDSKLRRLRKRNINKLELMEVLDILSKKIFN